MASAGGSGVGIHLLRRIAGAFAELRKDVPEAELLLVCGPRVDPRAIPPVEGMRASATSTICSGPSPAATWLWSRVV